MTGLAIRFESLGAFSMIVFGNSQCKLTMGG